MVIKTIFPLFGEIRFEKKSTDGALNIVEPQVFKVQEIIK